LIFIGKVVHTMPILSTKGMVVTRINFNEIIKNNKGISLIEVTVAAAMMITLSLGVMRATETVNRSVKSSERSLELTSVLNEMKTFLTSTAACENTFVTIAANAKNQAGITDIRDAQNNIIYSIGDIFSGVTLTSMSLSETMSNVSVVTNLSSAKDIKLAHALVAFR
jgi:hypothetical protein